MGRWQGRSSCARAQWQSRNTPVDPEVPIRGSLTLDEPGADLREQGNTDGNARVIALDGPSLRFGRDLRSRVGRLITNIGIPSPIERMHRGRDHPSGRGFDGTRHTIVPSGLSAM